MVYFPSLFGSGIPTSAWAVEAYSPLTPIISNYLSGNSYGLGTFGIGAGSLFGNGYLGAPPSFGPYGFFSAPSFIPMPFFMPTIPWLVSPRETSNWAPNHINPANFINFSSPQETSGAPVDEIETPAEEKSEKKKAKGTKNKNNKDDNGRPVLHPRGKKDNKLATPVPHPVTDAINDSAKEKVLRMLTPKKP